MTHRDTQEYRPPVVHGRRTRVIAALIGLLISVGVPVVILGAPGLTADGRTVAPDDRPGCHLPWAVLAGIGEVESGHASGGRVDAAGTTLGPILGPQLDGSLGTAAIPDTDHGVLDGDPVWDRAVGPMQFIPSSWRGWGVGSPDNIYDSTLAAGRYLCAGGADLSDPAQLHAAVLRYNHSAAYVDIVLRWAHTYLSRVIPTPSVPGLAPPGTNDGRPIVASGAPPAVVVAQPTPLAAAPFSATTTTPPVTTTDPVTTTPLPSPSSTTDPLSTAAPPAGP
ncbi:MAG: lytic transglycosylase domain-containing protein [Pseudonocardiaceae bacterium]